MHSFLKRFIGGLAVLSVLVLGAVSGSLVGPNAVEASACEFDACDLSSGNCRTTDLFANCDELTTPLGCASETCA